MITITIQRQNKNNMCTTGIFTATSDQKKEKIMGFTLEPPDVNNKNGISCILPDIYKAKSYNSPRFKTTVILLEDKHNRTAIEIHPGNYPKNTQGCILVGTMQGNNAVWKSRDKLAELIKFISNENIEVIVKDVI